MGWDLGHVTARHKRAVAMSSEKSAKALQNLPAFMTDKSNPIGYCVQGAYEFGHDSRRLIQRCTKPDAKEFKKIAVACAIGFAIMGFIGYTVKLVFIPINNIIVGGTTCRFRTWSERATRNRPTLQSN